MDVDALGLFIDNHDVKRFLNEKGDRAMFKAALTFMLTAKGIPIMYYGSEQEFNGADDPENRESLWPYFNPKSEIYQMTTIINKARKAMQSWD